MKYQWGVLAQIGKTLSFLFSPSLFPFFLNVRVYVWGACRVVRLMTHHASCFHSLPAHGSTYCRVFATQRVVRPHSGPATRPGAVRGMSILLEETLTKCFQRATTCNYVDVCKAQSGPGRPGPGQSSPLIKWTCK